MRPTAAQAQAARVAEARRRALARAEEQREARVPDMERERHALAGLRVREDVRGHLRAAAQSRDSEYRVLPLV
jgi:hypothetical protein